MQALHHAHLGGAVADYSLASALIAAPLWAPYLADVNALLTTAGLFIGLVLGVRRLIRDLKRDRAED